MRHEIILSNTTKQDIIDIMDWLDNKSFGVGNDFLSFLNASLERIALNPSIFKFESKKYQVCLIEKFQYKVYFHASKKKIKVIAVVHHARNPNAWKKRIERK